MITGYNVIEAASGEIGLEKFYNDNYALVLLDVMLPGIQGWDVFKRNQLTPLEKIGELEIDKENYKVIKNGKELNLGNKGFALLMYFILNKDLVLTREKILNNIWPMDFEVDERVVDTQIKLLRKKIGEGYIKTIRGVGYKFQEVYE